MLTNSKISFRGLLQILIAKVCVVDTRKKLLKCFKTFDDSEEKISCNCQHNSNLRDNEPCCRCDSRRTNADRIRNMSDEEIAEFLITFKNTFGEEYEGEASCMEWLQSEAKETATNMENLDVRR